MRKKEKLTAYQYLLRDKLSGDKNRELIALLKDIKLASRQVSKELKIIPTKNNQELCLKAGDYALLKTLIETSQYDCKAEKDALKELFGEELTRLQDTHKIKINQLRIINEKQKKEYGLFRRNVYIYSSLIFALSTFLVLI